MLYVDLYFEPLGKNFVSVRQYQENVCLLDPRLLPERSYESGSVPPSFLSSVLQFSWDWLISFSSNSSVFPQTQHGVRGPCGALRDRAGFFGEKNLLPRQK